MRTKKNISLIMFTIAQIIILFGLASYAWFSDKNSPSISQNNIKVTSAEGLVIKLTADSEARTSVNLNELMSDFDSFELRQMSSADAINFYTIDFGAGLSSNLPVYDLIGTTADGTIDMDQYGCIDYNFYLQTEDFAKHVYLHKDTSLVGSASDAIRVAVTVKDSNYDIVKIFGTEAENAANDSFVTRAVISEGEFDFSNVDNSFVSNQIVHTFDEFNGGRGTSDEDPIDLSKVLLTIPANTVVKINVKVWLEGGDPDCDNDLSNTFVDLMLKFGSANVLRDAPNVYANNSLKTITNLNATMEYAYTSTEETVWTAVTNSNMTFSSGATVYVRYALVEGVSPYSYVTTVTFNG